MYVCIPFVFPFVIPNLRCIKLFHWLKHSLQHTYQNKTRVNERILHWVQTIKVQNRKKNSGFLSILYIVFTSFHFKTINHRFNSCWYHLKLNTCKQFIYTLTFDLLSAVSGQASERRASLTDECHTQLITRPQGLIILVYRLFVYLFFFVLFLFMKRQKLREKKTHKIIPISRDEKNIKRATANKQTNRNDKEG